MESAGGHALAVQVDVRDTDQVDRVVAQAVERFGGIDALVNNAGAIALMGVEELPPKLYDRMMTVNIRAAYACAHACIPHLKRSPNGHILSLSPPIDLDPKWFGGHAVYTISKYAMTLLTIGLAEELQPHGVAANALWPRTTIATAAVELLGGESLMRASRRPEIVADAAHAILTSDAREFTGRAVLDEDLLRERGVTDFSPYAVEPGAELMPDLYVGDAGLFPSPDVR